MVALGDSNPVGAGSLLQAAISKAARAMEIGERTPVYGLLSAAV